MIGRYVRTLGLGIWLLLLVAVMQTAIAATAGPDLLDLPAKKTRAAAHALLLDVAVAGQRLVAVGERGIIVYSDDDGQTWKQADVPVSLMLTAVCFVTDKTGWAVGHDGVILKSVDGGQTWIKQFNGKQANALVRADAEARVSEARRSLRTARLKDKQKLQQALESAESSLEDAVAGEEFGPSRPLLDVWFRNETDGYAVGSYGQIFRTRNGGQTWASLGSKIINPEGLHYNSITGLPSGDVFIAGEAGKVYHSPDSGNSWRTLDTGYNGQLYGVVETGQKGQSPILLTFGFGGRIFRSKDGGQAWEQVGAGLKPVPLVAAAMLESGVIVVAAQDGSLLRSQDAGKSFAVMSESGALPVSAIATAQRGKVIALAGFGGVRFVPLKKTGSGAGSL